MMNNAGVGSVVVVEGDKPIGMLTERDMVRYASSGSGATFGRVSDWMAPDPLTVAGTSTSTPP